MKSIRLSLIVYFLLLVAGALTAVSLLVYQVTARVLSEKQATNKQLLQTQYEQNSKEIRAKTDNDLLAQARFGIHVRQVVGLVFSPDGKRLASVSGDGKLQVWAWDPTRLGQMRKPEFECDARVPGVYVNLAFSPDSQWLAHGGERHTVKIREAKTGRELYSLDGHSRDVSATAFSHDGRWLATAGEDTTVRIWDASSWKLQRTLRGHTGVVSGLAFSPDGRRLFSGSRDHTIKVWDPSRWEETSDR